MAATAAGTPTLLVRTTPPSPSQRLPRLPREIEMKILWTVRRHQAATSIQAAYRGHADLGEIPFCENSPLTFTFRPRDLLRLKRAGPMQVPWARGLYLVVPWPDIDEDLYTLD